MPVVRRFAYWCIDIVPNPVFGLIVQCSYRLKISAVTLRNYENNLFEYTDNKDSRVSSHRIRGLRLYLKGFQSRDLQLQEKYGLDQISFEPGDVIIDCGANYGDVFFALRRVAQDFKYYAVEPDPNALQALSNNVGDMGLTFGFALGNKDSDAIDFYLSDISGDSSLYAPDLIQGVISVPINTLSSFMSEHRLDLVRLLKIEAEGCEMEVLEGAETILRKVNYIAVDGSAERGGRETLSDLASYLQSNGFVLRYKSERYVSALFENRMAGMTGQA